MIHVKRVPPPAAEKPKPPITFAIVSPEGIRSVIEVSGEHYDAQIPKLDFPFGLLAGGGGEIRIKRWIKPA